MENMFDKDIPEKLKKIESLYVQYPRFKEMLDKIEYCHKISRISAQPECLLVTGQTGAGKTTLFNQYMSKYPRKVTETGIEVPILCATIPAPATHKGMIQKLLFALGDPAAHRGTKSDQTMRLIELLRECKVELIILDELQHFIDGDKFRILVTVSNWFKTLLIDTKIPFILFGLPEAEQVIDADEQLSRRFAHRHEIEPFKINNDTSFKEFTGFLAIIEQQLPLEDKSFLWKSDLANRIYYATDGNAGYIMTLLRKSAYYALINGYEKIDQQLLSKAFELHIQKDKPSKINPFKVDEFNVWQAIKEQRLIARPKNGVSFKLNARKEHKKTAKDVLG